MAPSYLFPRNSPLDVTSPSLVEFLAADPADTDVVQALEEFAWRNLTDGKRTRQWCSEISDLITRVPQASSIKLRSALRLPSLAVLFPLVKFDYDPDFPDLAETVPSQLLPASTLLNLSRNQVIDVLSKTSRERHVVHGDANGFRQQVLEMCLEYIGKRWRGGERNDADLVDSIARKLTEIEFEAQLQGHPVTVRTIILPALHTLRFSLGLVSSSQLTSRLNNVSHRSVRANVSFDPCQMITSWIVMRLRAGARPQDAVDELVEMREKIRTDGDKDVLSHVLASFGLLGRGRRVSDASTLDNPGLISAAAPSATSGSPSTAAPSPKRLVSQASTRKRVLPSSSGGHWWSQRRNNSSTSRLHNLAPLISTERRPSLPVIPSPGMISTTSLRSIGPLAAYNTSSSSLVTSLSSTHRLTKSHRDIPSMPDLLAALMTFDNPEDIRFILLDHLLGMRYRLSEYEQGDWCLGDGKYSADELLTGIEARLVGRKDVMGLRGIIVDLRASFGLPEYLDIINTAYKVRHRDAGVTSDHFPSVPPRLSLSPTSSDVPQPCSKADEGAASEEPTRERGRSVSFDILATSITSSATQRSASFAIPKPAPSRANSQRESVGAESFLTINTALTGFSPQRASFLSSYTIREATREYTQESIATQVRLPRRISSMTDLDIASLRRSTSSEESQAFDTTWHSKQGSRSQPDLVGIFDALGMNDDVASLALDEGIDPLDESWVARGRLGDSRRKRAELTPSNPPPLPVSHTFTFDPIDDYYATPITVPSVPFMPRLATIPSIPSMSSGGDAVDGNLAGLDTPPASPTPVYGSVFASGLLGPPYTPSTLGSRVNRQWAIVDGEHISPPRDIPVSACGDDDDSDYGTPTPEYPPTALGPDVPSINSAPTPPRRSARDHSLRSVRPLATSLDTDDTREIDLLDIMALFETDQNESRPRYGLQEEEVENVMKGIVASSSGEEARGRWLLTQMGALLGDSYSPFVEYYLDFLAPLPPLATPTPRRRSDPRHPFAPSSVAFPLTPPPGSPLSLYPESVEDQASIVYDDASRPVLHGRADSDLSQQSFISTHTFGTPA